MPRALDIINIILGVALLAILALITSDTLSFRLKKMVQSRGGKESVSVAAPPARIEELSFYAPILANGLFGNSTRGILAPVSNAPVAAVPSAYAPADLIVLGTAVGSVRETFALIRNATKKEERVFRLGDMVFDTGRLVEVKKEQAFILMNGKKVELLTPLSPPQGATNSPPQPLPQPVMVSAAGTGSYVIDQRALNSALDNPAQAMTDARLLPSQKDGKTEGFRVSEVKPNGVFAMIGLKNDDVLLRLNDFPVDSPDRALQSFIALKGQGRLKLDMIRDGRPVTFDYDIR